MLRLFEYHLLYLNYRILLCFPFYLFYLNVIPVSPCTEVAAIIFLEISTGIVVLAPESFPVIVSVVNNLLLAPNSV